MAGLNECKTVERVIKKRLRTFSDIHICHTSIKEGDTYEAYLDKLSREVHGVPKFKQCILFTVLTGSVGNVQKQIGYRTFPTKLQRVLKVIIATNVVESSVTIDNLAVVIDSGLYKQSTYCSSGISILETLAIPNNSRIQRLGRVGRVSPGICIQYVPSEQTNSSSQEESIKPAIVLENLSQKMLELRGLGLC